MKTVVPIIALALLAGCASQSEEYGKMVARSSTTPRGCEAVDQDPVAFPACNDEYNRLHNQPIIVLKDDHLVGTYKDEYGNTRVEVRQDDSTGQLKAQEVPH